MASESGKMIVRHHLIKIFNELEDKHFLYIHAPAGYGKTSAVRQWLDSTPYTNAVISINEYNNDIAHLCESLCNALIYCQPKNTLLSEIISHSGFNTAPGEFVLRAIGALTGRKRTVLVIDDLHIINDKKTLKFLAALLHSFPPNFQIVLISRKDIPSEISSFWLKGDLVRITSEQFLFSGDEIQSLYKQHGQNITPAQAEGIVRSTQGWAIGINALLLSGGIPSQEIIDSPSKSESIAALEEFIKTYLWDTWDETEKEFMLATAYTEVLIPPLCNTLAGVKDSEKIMDQLIRSGAFISKTKDGMYHYHHLFKNFIRHIIDEERGEEYVKSLINKEGEWYLTQQNCYAAVDCFIRCGNDEGIANSLDKLIIVTGNYTSIEHSLPFLNHPQLLSASEKYPQLLYLIVWAAYIEGRADEALALLDRYYAWQPEIEKLYPEHANKIHALRFIDYRISLKQWSNEMAAKLEISSPKPIKGNATLNMPFAHRSTYDYSELALGDTEADTIALHKLTYWVTGENSDVLYKCQIAELLLEQGFSEKAYSYAHSAVAEINNFTTPAIKWCAMATLVSTEDALGHEHEAKVLIKHISDMIEKDRAYHLNSNYNAFLTRRRIVSGGMESEEAAKTWVSEYELTVDDPITLYGLYTSFTTCRAYIALGNYSSAIILLKKILELVKEYNRPLDIIEAQILLSIALRKKKHSLQDDAMRYLEDAASTAYPYRYTQIFINEAANIAGMMQQLLKRAEQKASANAALPVSFIRMLVLKMPKSKFPVTEGRHGTVKLKYTDKQKAVMKQLCEGKSFREISGALGITLPTLKSHISLIYQKLDVVKKEEAVERILELHLIDT
jgi:LuxR family maltose regulon positive regulatory protein